MNTSKKKKYERLKAQIAELTAPVDNIHSRMATIAAVLHHKMPSFFWTGFYIIDSGELLVSAYQGPLACLRLQKDKGVCWAAVNSQETVVVDNVHDFPGHIACSSLSNSEIVVPVFDRQQNVTAVLDIDSREYSTFDQVDKQCLEEIVSLIHF